MVTSDISALGFGLMFSGDQQKQHFSQQHIISASIRIKPGLLDLFHQDCEKGVMFLRP